MLKLKRWMVISIALATIMAVLPAVWLSPPLANKAGTTSSQLGSGALVATKKIFNASEQPELHLNFDRPHVGFGPSIFGLGYASAALGISTEVSYNGRVVDVPVKVTPNGSSYDLKLAPKGDIKPGKYSVQAKWGSGRNEQTASQSFAWGVLAINTTQAAYLPGDTAHIEMAVLSSTGHTLCGAPVTLTVTGPDMQAGSVPVSYSPACIGDTYVEVPDYTADYRTKGVGRYTMQLRLAESDYTIDESFVVADALPFVIERSAPTRLYPPYAYTSKITVTANRDFNGTVTEQLPAGFTVQDAGHTGPADRLSWQVKWQTGHKYTLSYRFKAPQISPASYRLSPLRLADGSNTVYQEPRGWQIAGDAVVTFVQQASGAAVSATNFSFSTTSGNTVVLSVSNALGATGSVTAVSDSAGGSLAGGAWVAGPAIGATGATNTFLAMFYQVNAPALTTIQFTTAGGTPAYTVSEYTNVVTASPLDQSASLAANTAGTSLTGASITTANANDLIYAAISHAGGSGATASINTGTSTPGTYTALTEGNNGTTHNLAAYQVVAATGAAEVDWTISASAKAGMGIVALKGGTSGPTTDQMMRGGNSLVNGVDGGFFWAN